MWPASPHTLGTEILGPWRLGLGSMSGARAGIPHGCRLPHVIECREVTHSFFLPWGQGRGGRGVLDFPLQFSPVLLKVLIDTSSAGRWYPTNTLALAMWLPGHARLTGGGCCCPPDSAVQPCPLFQLSSHPQHQLRAFLALTWSRDLVGNLASHPESYSVHAV